MPVQPDSMSGQIVKLAVGESFSVAKRISLNDPKATTKVAAARDYVKNRVSPYVARAKVETGGTYTTETGIVQTHDLTAMLVVAVVTRLKP